VRELGAECLPLRADVADAGQVATMFTAIDVNYGQLDVLVCNAGVLRDTLLGASEPADFDAVFAVNISGVVNCCREACKRMVSRRRGAIVNLSSVAATRPGRGQSNYAASKGAVEAFTRALAPDELNKRILLKRLGSAREVAAVVGFLCSDEASYVTAQVWNVDGGFKAE
jgi:3-oxoacyl-[acyl-carrier protein] reductase